MQGQVGLRGRRRVFHSAEDEVLHGDLRVLVPRVLLPEVFFVEGDHGRGVLESSRGVLFAAGLAVEIDQRPFFLLNDARELARHQGNQVHGVFLVLKPTDGPGPVLPIPPVADQAAV